ncbi:MAG: trypsin-like peptidase domain-containing protein, partial [Planctomycetota bacterium]
RTTTTPTRNARRASLWFVSGDRGVTGPFTPDELQAQAAAGDIGPDTPVGADGELWVAAQAHPVVSKILGFEAVAVSAMPRVSLAERFNPLWGIYAVAGMFAAAFVALGIVSVFSMSEGAAAFKAKESEAQAAREPSEIGEAPAPEESPEAVAPPPSPPLANLPPDEIFARCVPAIVHVMIQDRDRKPIGAGSGFFVSEDGLIVTNLHVVAKAHFAQVVLADKQKISVRGVAALDEDADIAILKVAEQAGMRPLQLSFRGGQNLNLAAPVSHVAGILPRAANGILLPFPLPAAVRKLYGAATP